MKRGFIRRKKQDFEDSRDFRIPRAGERKALDKIARKAKHYKLDRGFSEEFLSYELERIHAARAHKEEHLNADTNTLLQDSQEDGILNITTNQIKNEFLREERLLKRKSFIKRFIGLMLVVVAISAIVSTFLSRYCKLEALQWSHS